MNVYVCAHLDHLYEQIWSRICHIYTVSHQHEFSRGWLDYATEEIFYPINQKLTLFLQSDYSFELPAAVIEEIIHHINHTRVVSLLSVFSCACLDFLCDKCYSCNAHKHTSHHHYEMSYVPLDLIFGLFCNRKLRTHNISLHSKHSYA